MHPLTLALLAGVLASAPGEDDAALVAAVVARFREIESCARTLSVEIEVLVTELDGVALAPPARTSVLWRTRSGRAYARVSGLDLDGLGSRSRRDATIERLCLPGGATETLDQASGSWSRDQRSYLDAATLASDLGPGEFVSTFCGAWRSAILAGRPARVVELAGASPERVITIEADDRAGRQRIAFECAEAWGLLPRCCRMSVREGGAWRELRRIDVHEARLTRLGWFPAKASLTALRPAQDTASGPSPVFARTTATYRFAEPELAAVVAPRSLAPEASSSRPSDPDPIFSSASALFREPVAGRGADLDDLLRPLGGMRRAAAGRGTIGAWVRLRAAAGPAVAALGLCGLALARKRLVVAAAAAGIACVVAWAALGSSRSPAGCDAAGLVAGLVRVEAPVPPPSRTLCGVDCLHVALRLAGETPDYARLVKLVRPGAHGTTLEALAIAAECAGSTAVAVDPRAWSSPPDPLIAHVDPSHFVVVAALLDGTVAVVDPARGIFRGSWEEVRGSLSRAACALVPGGRS